MLPGPAWSIREGVPVPAAGARAAGLALAKTKAWARGLERKHYEPARWPDSLPGRTGGEGAGLLSRRASCVEVAKLANHFDLLFRAAFSVATHADPHPNLLSQGQGIFC